MRYFKRLLKPVVRIARWYASPTGAVAAVALIAALVLVASGHSSWAIGVLALWLGLIVPYKLNREAERIERNADNVKRVRSDLAMSPTIEELASWQETVDIRIAAAQAKVASLEQLSESLQRQRGSSQLHHRS